MRYVIVGCGRMGAELARALHKGGHDVTLVDRDREAADGLDPSLRGRTFVGSGFDRDVLERAGIGQADGLAAMTSSDESNVILARLARVVFHVPKVVARLRDPRREDLYRRFGIQVAAPITWVANRLADLLSYSELDAVASLGHGQVEIVQFDASALLEGRTAGDIAIPGEAQVVAMSRSGLTFIPSPETVFQRGDTVHIAVSTASSKRLRAMLELM
jgi:trk system potassium uptake protein TrkA